MQQQLLTSGRVHWFPMSDASPDGTVTSLLSGQTTIVSARKVVDAAHSKMQVPSTHTPGFGVSADATLIPLNVGRAQLADHSDRSQRSQRLVVKTMRA
jgi:hypothetical protein